jgi:hypothetical protein
LLNQNPIQHSLRMAFSTAFDLDPNVVFVLDNLKFDAVSETDITELERCRPPTARSNRLRWTECLPGVRQNRNAPYPTAEFKSMHSLIRWNERTLKAKVVKVVDEPGLSLDICHGHRAVISVPEDHESLGAADANSNQKKDHRHQNVSVERLPIDKISNKRC